MMLILGGTFDPPHIGHLVLAEAAREELGAAQVVLMPAGEPWRKRADLTVARSGPSPANVRLAMTRLAAHDANRRAQLAGPPRLVVDEREVRRAGPTYTAETLAQLVKEGNVDLVLLLGSDALADMPRWHEPQRIFELARVAVAPKPGGVPVESARRAVARAVPGAAGRIVELATVPPLALSSTLIRERVAAGLSIRYLVPGPVERYIQQRGLYR
jgi:nicotinate-nucleotide adenylyltransferase